MTRGIRQRRRPHLRWIALAALFVGCDAPDGEDIEDIEARPYHCPTWQCGFNSAEINGRSIRELNLDGVANEDGVRIVGFVAPTGLLGNYRLDVDGDELIARNNGGSVLRGPQLIGATILVKKPGLLSLPLPITILNYQEIDGWADGAGKVPAYAMLYLDLESLLGVRNVCNGDLLDVLATAATVLGGETYDLDAKEIRPGRDRWLTIACAGSAAAKMRLMNYGPHGDFDGEGHPASVAQRQATLKMITADYCGDGDSYTHNHVALQWENSGGTVISPGPFGVPEAIWGPAGALCLDATRLADADVACALPACDGLSLDDGEWATFVPD
ncbi:ADYC domain-containing protein [Nannocystis punicea]|uniref:ADYC domain-containing protein n=1 Tax=Nannocystis punicea TaxID=2995304 RepID=A0ABY7H2D2_9BACT|nr:ADYC domain-containing protein [Nannocystis poenicansa]WAS93265.1 ADYC domain-containing protein [Nannocystis poenicansa]